jgi:uncharacterized protein (DUF2336 family)
LKNPDPKQRRAIAARKDAPADVLFALAADPVPAVRQALAGNSSAPAIISPILAHDDDVDVRGALLRRLVKLLPDLSADMHDEIYKSTLAALETLAHDQVAKVREALSTTLKDVAFAPPSVVKCLAADIEEKVAAPILQLCQMLSDEDLLEIIAKQKGPWALAAIAGRARLSGAVSNAIVDSGDVRAGAILLDNKGAIIEDTTLAHMVEQSATIREWQAKLARRPGLPRLLAVRLAEFVDESVRRLLEKRNDFDPDTAREVANVTRRRLDYAETATAKESPEARAKRMQLSGELTEESLLDAISWKDRDFVIAALALLAKLPGKMIGEMLETKNGKLITALSWRAKLSMRFAMQLQSQLAGVPSRDVVIARGGTQYPMTEDEMRWQLEFVGAG